MKALQKLTIKWSLSHQVINYGLQKVHENYVNDVATWLLCIADRQSSMAVPYYTGTSFTSVSNSILQICTVSVSNAD